MGRSMIRPLKLLLAIVQGGGSPRAIALGCALGMAVGLLPKGNLIAALLAAAVLATRTNLGAAALATLGFSWVAVWTDPLAHRIGWSILTQPSWQTSFASLFELPLAAWTALNNTVVLGSLLLSIVLFYPVYRLAWLVTDQYHAWIARRLQTVAVEKIVAGSESAARWKVPRSP